MLALLVVGLMAGASPAWAEIGEQPDDVPQTDGIVFSVLPVGNMIYIGGDFDHVDGVPRENLAAVNATTGELTDWNPGASGKVFSLAASPDGTRIYAGGGFSKVGGVTRNRVAAINATTGATETGFNPGKVDKAVRAVVAAGGRLYLGGDFTSVQGQGRTRLALLDGDTGALVPNWAPAASDRVRSLALSPDGTRIYAGGRFTTVSGQSRLRLAALDPANLGAVLSWRPLSNPNGQVIDLAVSGERVYAAAGGVAGAAESYDAVTGARAWQLRGDGDVQAITVTGGKAYVGGHFLRFAGQDRRFFTALNPLTGALDPNWAPTGSGTKLTEPTSTGVWDFAPDESRGRLYAGTNFTTVNGQRHAGFVQFSDAVDSKAPTVTSVSPADGAQDVRLTANVEATFSENMDAATLNDGNFTLIRVGDPTPLPATVAYDVTNNKATLTPASPLEASQTYTARITTGARDVAGNALAGDKVWSFTTTASTDVTAPSVQPPDESFVANSQLGTSDISVRLAWSATDDDSGVAGYELQQSTNGGAYQYVALPSPAATTSTTLRLTPGSTYQFRVRATDASGNTSGWASGSQFVLADHQESDADITYTGGWTDQSLGTAYGGSLKFAQSAGESATFTFVGSEVAWIAPKASDAGRAEVYVDGSLVSTIDLYSSSAKPRRAVFTQSVTPGEHTLEVLALGTKRRASSGTRVGADAFFVLP